MEEVFRSFFSGWKNETRRKIKNEKRRMDVKSDVGDTLVDVIGGDHWEGR